MNKQDKQKLKSLRMGIPIAMMAANTAAAALTSDTPKKQDDLHKIELNEYQNQPLEDSRTCMPADEFIYNLQYNDEEKALYRQESDTLKNISYETKSPKELHKSEAKSLKEAYEDIFTDKFETGEVTIRDDTTFYAHGKFTLTNKKITINKVNYDQKYLRKYIANNVLDDDARFSQFCKILGTNSPSLDAMADILRESLDKINSPETVELVKKHEGKHRLNDKQGINLCGISALQYASLNQTDEISANINALLHQREQYLKTGDIKHIKFAFYKQAVLDKQIVAGSRVKSFEKAELSLIINGMQKFWQEQLFADYKQQTLHAGLGFAANYAPDVLKENEKELQRREQVCLTFEINGRKVNLCDYRDKRPEVPKEIEDEIIKMQIAQRFIYSPENLKIARSIKSQKQLNKLKLEKCRNYHNKKQNQAAHDILEKQGQLLRQKMETGKKTLPNSPFSNLQRPDYSY